MYSKCQCCLGLGDFLSYILKKHEGWFLNLNATYLSQQQSNQAELLKYRENNIAPAKKKLQYVWNSIEIYFA